MTRAMADLIQECLLDLPLTDFASRPEGMLAIRRDDVPAEYREMVDRWVQMHDGRVEEEPLIVVHGGKSPGGGGGAKYYVLPPQALVPEDDD